MENHDRRARRKAIPAFAKASAGTDLDLDPDFERAAVGHLAQVPPFPMPDRESLIMQGAETTDSGLILEQDRSR